MITRTLVAVLAATASLAVAACGSDNETPASSNAQGKQGGLDAASKKAMLKFAQCMRDHGVDMPDPTFDQGGGKVVQRVKGGGEDTMRAAQQACQKYQDQVKPPPVSEEQEKKMKTAALKNAQCMRDHGVTNFPDPQFGEGGRMTMKLGKDAGIDPQSPTFQAAMKACQKESPGGMMFGAGPSSGGGK
jgi:hypothetical protein